MTYDEICNEFFKDFKSWHEKNSVSFSPIPEALDWEKFNYMTKELIQQDYGFSDRQYEMIVGRVGKFNRIECYMNFVDRVMQYSIFLTTFAKEA